MNALTNRIVAAYNPTEPQFARIAQGMIDEYFDSLPASKSKTDPQRLGSRSVYTTKIRQALLESLGSATVAGQPAFNAMGPKDQLRFQIQSNMTGNNPWVAQVKILPDNVRGILFNDSRTNQLNALRLKTDTAKLRKDATEIDGDMLIDTLGPYLVNGKKFNEIVAALLLVTGRRTIEILKTGSFYLGKDMSATGYEAMFTGQAKQSLMGVEDYRIPLLAPFYLVKSNLARVREMRDCSQLTTDDVNASYSKTINDFTSRRVQMPPHMLRSCYAIISYQLLQGKKMPFTGWASKILGHANPANALFYTRLAVENCTHAYEPPAAEKEIAQQQTVEDEGWNVSGAVETKKLVQIMAMMDHKIPISASSIRTHCGGTIAVAQRMISKNQKLIDKYNNSL